MSASNRVLPWLVAVVTLIAYLIGGMFVLHGFTPLPSLRAEAEDMLALAFATASALACVLGLVAMHRRPLPERLAILRLPRSKAAGWALGFAAAYVLATFLFTGNTLFNLLRQLGVPEERFGAMLKGIEGFGLLSVVVCALAALVLALVALIKNRDRGLVLGLPLLPAFLVFGFVLGELLVPH